MTDPRFLTLKTLDPREVYLDLERHQAAVKDLAERIRKAEAWDGGCAIGWMSPTDAHKIKVILEYHGVWPK